MTSPIRLPERPLVVRPPGVGLASRLWAVVVSLVVAAGLALVVIPPIGDLRTDFALAGKAQPIPGAHVDGRCSVTLAVLNRCDATLTGNGASRRVDYFFLDLHAGGYQVQVLADPAHPERLTTDLALAKLWNRVVTLALLGPLFALFSLGLLFAAGAGLRAQRATVRALSGQPLRTVLLRLDRYALGRWTVSSRTWDVPGRARPIVMDPAQGLILGVTAGDGAIAMPLDRDLTWIVLDGAERQRLVDELGPDRLGGWLARLSSPAQDAIRRRLRTMARVLAVIGLVSTAGGGVMLWRLIRRGVGQTFDVIPPVLVGAVGVGLLLGALAVWVRYRRLASIYE